MTHYINPVENVKQGRRLEGQSYTQLVKQLKPGEFLYGYYDRLVFKCAPHLHSETEFNLWYEEYRKGVIVSLPHYYAIPSESSGSHMEQEK